MSFYCWIPKRQPYSILKFPRYRRCHWVHIGRERIYSFYSFTKPRFFIINPNPPINWQDLRDFSVDFSGSLNLMQTTSQFNNLIEGGPLWSSGSRCFSWNLYQHMDKMLHFPPHLHNIKGLQHQVRGMSPLDVFKGLHYLIVAFISLFYSSEQKRDINTSVYTWLFSPLYPHSSPVR